ncbi:MAG: sugar phosphate nucleotidyltransferase [Patescibacteria group bacterium]|nr:sugar phosphate nucleotidyltransferase [Patescibacteria group bacterium]
MRKRSRITITLKEDLLKNIDSIVDGIEIKNRSHAIESLLSKNFKEQKIKKAVILAGGRGVLQKGNTRLISRILTNCKGKMFVEHIFDWLRREGIKEVIISAGGLSQEVKNKIGDGREFNLQVSYLPKDTGTASILKYLVNIIDETFLMMNGDVLSDVNLDEMFDFHKKSGGLCTIGIISVKEPSSFGTIKLKGNQIVDFIEKPEKGKEESYLINAGIYLVEPEIYKLASYKCLSLEKTLFPSLAKKGSLFGYHLQGRWTHLGFNGKDLKK